MKNKYKIGLVCIALIILYGLPMMLFKLQDKSLKQNIHTLNNTYNVSAEAYEINLVQRIHSGYFNEMNDDYIYDIDNLLSKKKRMSEEIKKLYEFDIIDVDILKKYEEIQTNEDYGIYEYNRTQLYSENYSLNDDHIGSIGLDPQTNKILSLYLPYEKEIFDQKEKAYSYIQYLGLDILGDWKYEKGTYYSEKAQLCVKVSVVYTMFDSGKFSYFNIQVEENYPDYSLKKSS